MTYTVSLQNIGEMDTAGVLMTDTLPARVTFAGGLGDNHGAVESDGAISWLGAVDSGAALTWTWQVTFTGGYGRVDNTAWYSHAVAGQGSVTATFRPPLQTAYFPLIFRSSPSGLDFRPR